MTSPVKLTQMITAQTVAAKYPPKVLKEVAGYLKPEPTFGLAVTGIVNPKNLKPNSKAQVGDVLFITKPLGIGFMATAEKQDKLLPKDIGIATE